jgi:acetyl-CoA carboxylase carboxyl transferase subunit beta
MVDMVVHRHELRPTIARLLRILTKQPATGLRLPAPEPAEEPAEAKPAEAEADKTPEAAETT